MLPLACAQVRAGIALLHIGNLEGAAKWLTALNNADASVFGDLFADAGHACLKFGAPALAVSFLSALDGHPGVPLLH